MGGRQLVCSKHQVKLAPEPFAQGSVRYARWGQLNDKSAESPWRACVLKEFKSRDARQHSIENYLMEMEVNAVAAALALEFNKAAKPPPNRQMRYVGASVATVKEPWCVNHYFVEEALTGEFTRYSYNTGYWEEATLDQWLLKFALFTHEVTKGYLMVADLQGVLTEDGYVLTRSGDPLHGPGAVWQHQPWCGDDRAVQGVCRGAPGEACRLRPEGSRHHGGGRGRRVV